MSRFDWSRVRFMSSDSAKPWTPEEAAAFAERVEEIAEEEDRKRVPPPVGDAS